MSSKWFVYVDLLNSEEDDPTYQDRLNSEEQDLLDSEEDDQTIVENLI